MYARILILSIILFGCRGTRVQHKTETGNLPGKDKNIVQTIDDFSLKIFSGLNATSPNMFLSPYSIYTATSMVYEGAGENTYRQISSVLGTSAPVDSFLNNLSDLTRSLQKDNAQDSVELSLANSLWIEENYPILESFSSAQKKYFQSDVRLVDFINPGNRELTRNEINSWAKEQTGGKIPELIGNNALNNLTRLILVNAIYFKGSWKYPFDPKSSRKGKFHLFTGDSSAVTYMYKQDKYRYYEQPEYQVVELPYLNSSLSMLLLLPKQIRMTDSIKNHLSSETIDSIYSGLKLKNVRLKIPQFQITSELNLKPVLEKMGMTEAFTNSADFSGISGKTDLKIDQFFQKAYIKVNESGSEAAAATAVIMQLKSALISETIDFRADHPFLFFIADSSNHVILFAGQVGDPSKLK